jgi:hypothetical protein
MLGPQPVFPQSPDLRQQLAGYPPASSARYSTRAGASAASRWASAAPGGGW